MRKLWGAATLRSTKSYHTPTPHVLDMSTLNGGLNTWELEYKLLPNQSPDLLNVCWKDGSLSSRKGQEYVYEALEEDDPYGAFYACYEREWKDGLIVAHKGTCIYEIDYETGEHTEKYSGLSEQGGTFFVFGDKLYYMNGAEYIQMDAAGNVSEVEPYIPTVVMNRAPDGTGGDQYQPENRIGSGKGVWFTADGTSTAYVLPYQELEDKAVTAIVNGVVEYEKQTYATVADLPEEGDPNVIYVTTTPSATYTWSKVNDTWQYQQLLVFVYTNQLDATVPVDCYAYASNPNKYYKRVLATDAPGSAVTKVYSHDESAGLTVTVSSDADFRAAYPDGTTFTYNGDESQWADAKGTLVPDLSTVGLSVSGTPADGDSFVVESLYFVEVPFFFPGNMFTVNRTTGVITFGSAPAQSSPIVPNNVKVTCYKGDEATKQSILACRCVTVYGSGTTLAVVCGGNSAQPNAYFWSGNTSVSVDAGYFPFDYYNFAGQADEYITGFGKQQSMLIILKERSIGKAHFEIETISGRDYLRLAYRQINEIIGCNLPKTIQLVENNLVFANTYAGVHILLDTSAAGENNVIRLSRNVNGPDDANYGLLHDVRAVSGDVVTAFDDSQRYWITANGHAYLWDYTISSYRTKEERLSWFLFDNITPVCWFHTEAGSYYGRTDGSLVTFANRFSDFDEPIVRRYTFATQAFGTYEVLKDVLKVIFAVRSDTNTLIRITYKTDYEEREDLTPINAYSYSLVPRNLSFRNLNVLVFAKTAVRMPRCFHVRHFSMTLENSTKNTDMSVISAQIIYRYMREDR